MALPLTVPLGRNETTTSFTSRLAAANGLNANQFCRDWGFAFSEVIKGNQAAIAKIAKLGGVDKHCLQQQAFIRDNRLYRHRGQILNRDTIRIYDVCFCPACLCDDIRAESSLDAELAVYARAAWMIQSVATCHIHHMPLARTFSRPGRGQHDDFALNIRKSIPRLDKLAASSPRRRPNGLEIYVLDRLEGVAGQELLDILPLFAAIKVCEVIGSVALYGIQVKAKTLSESKMLPAFARGFEIVNDGPEGIGRFLSKLQATSDERDRKDGPGAVFGRIYHWLMDHKLDPAYAPIRRVIGTYVVESFPVGIKTKLFDDVTVRQPRHSIRTLSLETGRHPKKLRKVLRAAGIIGDTQMASSDHNVTFDAQAATTVIAAMERRLYLPAARAYLNAPRSQADLLIKHGFIKAKDPIAGTYDQYSIDDLDAFLRHLMVDARPVDHASAAMADIPGAARRAHCSAVDVLQMILEGRLAWVGRLRQIHGYQSVLVNVDEVKAAVRGPDHGGLTHAQVREALRTNHRVLLALIANGLVIEFRARNPVTRRVQSLVHPLELARFQKTYVSLHVLADERKQHHLVLRKELDAAGVKPVFDPKTVHARFYRRCDCAD